MLALLFFVSGAAGLVYESIWSRELHHIFGTSQFAIATVLAAFMTGLAAGGALGARFAPRVRRPLRVYAGLELAIGMFALGFPFLLRGVEPLYVWFWRTFQPGVLSFGVFQFVVLGALLLVPTACMGATLPLLVRLPVPGGAGQRVGRLYAINTMGAVFGTALAGFWLLPGLGVAQTTWLAAGTNAALAAVAWAIDRPGATAHTTLAAAPMTTGVPDDRLWLVLAALAGFSALGLEVAWFRLMGLILGASTYAFTVMLLAFLVGIATGGEVGGPLADRLAARGRLVHGLVAAQLAVAVLTWAAAWGWQWLPLAFLKLYYEIPPIAHAIDPQRASTIAGELLWPAKCLLALLVMAPPAFFMGATFPLLVRAAGGSDLSRTVGRVYAANTAGSLSGAFLAGFVLMPALHVRGTVLFCIGVNVLVAVMATFALPGRRRESGTLALGAAALGLLLGNVAPRWDPMLMTTGMYKYVDNLDADATQADIHKQMIERYELLYYGEGLSTVVTVARNTKTGNVWLANNGKIEASSTTDMPTQLLVSHLPFLFTGASARRVMVIGLASGITLGAATLHPEVEHFDVVEIEPKIKKATKYFEHVNHRALDDRRVRLIANDGRNQLLLTEAGTYDIIVCEPSNPWLTGVSNLFTRDFFELGKTRLATGGVWAQWVQMYGMGGRDMKSVMRTFATVFPYAHTFATIEDADLVMVGSQRPLPLDIAAVRALRGKTPALTADFDRIELRDEWLLLETWLFDRDQMLSFSGTHKERIVDDLRPDAKEYGPEEEVPLNTDDNMLVEFSAPKNLHRETSTSNFWALRSVQGVPEFAVTTADELVELGMAYRDRDQLPRALMALKAALAREPDRADIAELYRDWQRELLGEG